MFSGLIQGLGEIVGRTAENGEIRFRIRALFNHSEWTDGESIAVNGVCLSVETHDHETFTVYASRETLQHSTLANLSPGTKINLEQALAMGERLGGHLLSGHVDCVATIAALAEAGQSHSVRVSYPAEFSAQIIDRGSVALDGISLTVTSCGKGFLTVNLIPDTWKRTNAQSWRKNSHLNMETDLIGKYVARYLELQNSPGQRDKKVLNMDFLARNGFL